MLTYTPFENLLKDLKKKERELQAREADLRKREDVT